MTRTDIEGLLEEIVTLPSLPRNIDHITTLVNAPDTALAELGKAIAVDPAFALKTLRLANSAHYGTRQSITSVELAVTLLGIKVIRNLVFTAMVGETMRGADSLLRHSVACGLVMRTLAEYQGSTSPVDANEAFTYGLLHDIGKVVFETYLPEEGEQAAEMSRAKRVPLHVAEKAVLGLDHAEIGAMLAARWRLPQRLTDTIASHHQVTACADATVQRIAATLVLADAICTYGGLEAAPQTGEEVSEQEWGYTRLRKTDLPIVLERFFAVLPSLDQMIGIAT